MIHAAFYKAIRDKLYATNPGIKHIDLWNNQVDTEEEEIPFMRPAVFIEFTDGIVQRLGNKRYAIEYEIRIHIVSDVTGETSRMEIFPVVPPAPNATPDAMVDLALAHLEMIDLIAYALDGFSVAAEGIGGMMWVGMAPGLSNVSDITEDIMVWRVRLTTDVAKRILINAAPVDPVVTPVVIHP